MLSRLPATHIHTRVYVGVGVYIHSRCLALGLCLVSTGTDDERQDTCTDYIRHAFGFMVMSICYQIVRFDSEALI